MDSTEICWKHIFWKSFVLEGSIHLKQSVEAGDHCVLSDLKMFLKQFGKIPITSVGTREATSI